MKVTYIGLESGGKSVMLYRQMIDCIDRNARWNKITGKSRKIGALVPMSHWLLEYAKSKNVEVVIIPSLEWASLNFRGGDLFLDELGIYFDSRNYADLPLHIRRWIAQCAKLGVHIYGTAQNFNQVDISYRRLNNYLYKVTKLAGSKRPHETIPGSKHPWAIFMATEFVNAVGIDGEPKFEFTGLVGGWSLTFLSKRDREMFDTGQEVQESPPPPLKRVERHWIAPRDTMVGNRLVKEGEIGHTITKYI